MKISPRTTVRTAAAAPLVLVLLATSQPVCAGVLTKCDNLRIAAHNAVLDKYNELFSALDDVISQMQANHLDPTKLPYRDKDNKVQLADMVALRADLEKQEEHDAGRADREVARDCDTDDQPIKTIASHAEAIAAIGITTMLSKEMGNIDFSESPFQLSQAPAKSPQ
jgi:hypothetical protein